jgi:Tol biopolymer transport system component
VSPDGRSIAFIRIFVDRASALDVQAFGGRRVRLARARHPDRLDLQAWTPDGQYLLYSRGAGTSPYTLWRIPVGGGEPLDMRFSTGPTVNVVSVSPDGGHIAYVDRFNDTELWITPLPSSPSRK